MSDELSIKQIELIRSASINTADEFLRMPPATVRCLCDLALRALSPSDAEMPEPQTWMEAEARGTPLWAACMLAAATLVNVVRHMGVPTSYGWRDEQRGFAATIYGQFRVSNFSDNSHALSLAGRVAELERKVEWQNAIIIKKDSDIYALSSSGERARALEEAAKVCDVESSAFTQRLGTQTTEGRLQSVALAKAIRALLTSPPPSVEREEG